MYKQQVLMEPLKNYDLTPFRYVAANRIAVRLAPRMKSKVVENIYLGEVVQLLDRKNKWSHIECVSEDRQLGGWVLNKYLCRLQR